MKTLRSIWRGMVWAVVVLAEVALVVWFIWACFSGGGGERRGWR